MASMFLVLLSSSYCYKLFFLKKQKSDQTTHLFNILPCSPPNRFNSLHSIYGLLCHESTSQSIHLFFPPPLPSASCDHEYLAAFSSHNKHPLACTVPSATCPGIFLFLHFSSKIASSVKPFLTAPGRIHCSLLDSQTPVYFSIVGHPTLHIYDFFTRQLSPQDLKFLKAKRVGLIILSQ